MLPRCTSVDVADQASSKRKLQTRTRSLRSIYDESQHDRVDGCGSGLCFGRLGQRRYRSWLADHRHGSTRNLDGAEPRSGDPGHPRATDQCLADVRWPCSAQLTAASLANASVCATWHAAGGGDSCRGECSADNSTAWDSTDELCLDWPQWRPLQGSAPRRASARSTDRSRHSSSMARPEFSSFPACRICRHSISGKTNCCKRLQSLPSYQRLRWHWDSASIRGLGSPLSSRQRSRSWRRSSAWRSVRCCDLGCQSQPSDIGFSLACWRWAAACSRGSFSNTPFPASSCSLMVERETAPRRCCKPSW
jgi:hypothetical protein